jgi:hypothetical protein
MVSLADYLFTPTNMLPWQAFYGVNIFSENEKTLLKKENIK